MAEVKKAVLGEYHGSLGNISFTTWKGKNVMRTKSAPKGEPTIQQIAVRKRFEAFQKLIKAFFPTIKESFKELATDITTSNAFFKSNTPVITIVPDIDVNGNWNSFSLQNEFDKMVVSGGSYIPVDNPILTNGGVANSVDVNWEFTAGSMGQGIDLAFLVVYEPTSNEIRYRVGTRTSLSLNLELPDSWNGKEIVGYIYTSDSTKKHFSTSKYLGTLTII